MAEPQRKRKKPRPDPRKITEIFGRVVSHPDVLGGRPYLRRRFIAVEDIVELFQKGVEDKDILAKYTRLTQEDLDACRAWQARFRPGTLKKIFNRAGKGMFFMLDENINYMILPEVVRIFGRSSHVYAEKLKGKQDEKDIWAYAVANKYKVILTHDSDFVDISLKHRRRLLEQYGSIRNAPEHIPVVILVPRKSRSQIINILEKHQDAIRQFASDNDAVYAVTSFRDGFEKFASDTELQALVEKYPSDKGPDAPAPQ